MTIDQLTKVRELAELITDAELDINHTNKEYYLDRINYWKELLTKFIEEFK